MQLLCVLALLSRLILCTAGKIKIRQSAKFFDHRDLLRGAFATFDGQELYPTKQEKGARLAYALISNHAFVDGNKRIGMYVLLTFLETNGIKIRPSVDEVARVGLAVAAGEMKYQQLLEWILENE